MIEVSIKQATTTRYNRKVRPRDLDLGDLVLRRVDMGNKNDQEGKGAANWEGSYKVTASTGTSAYILESLDDLPIPKAWNAEKLKCYYS